MEQSRVQHVEFDKVQCRGYMSPADVWVLACLIDRIFPHLVIAPDAQGMSRLPRAIDDSPGFEAWWLRGSIEYLEVGVRR